MGGRCPNGHSNIDGSQFCAVCGVALSDRPAPAPSLPPSVTSRSTGYPPPTYTQPFANNASFATYQPTGYARTGNGAPRNGMGIAALVLGIISVITGLLGIVLGTLAVIFGSIGLGRAGRGEATNKAMAGWGLGLGIAGVVIGLIVLAAIS